MRLPRVQFTVRTLLVGIALLGTNLAAVVMTLRAQPRDVGGIGMSGATYNYYDDGSIVLRPDAPPGAPGWFRPYVLRPARPGTWVRRWGPAIVAAITTVFGLAAASFAFRSRDDRGETAASESTTGTIVT
jgi:hypothetical protein